MPTRAFAGQFDALVVRIIDGDTIEADMAMGLGITIRGHIRFYGINAPEHNTPAGVEAIIYLESILPVGALVRLEVRGREKYGRFLAEIFYNNLNINMAMFDSGHAAHFLLGNDVLSPQELSPLTPPESNPQFPILLTVGRVYIGGKVQ